MRHVLVSLALLSLILAGCEGSSGPAADAGGRDLATGGADGGSGVDAGGDAEVGGGAEDSGGPVGTAHPNWPGATWEEFVPAPAERATYHVTTFGNTELDLEARIVEDAEFLGETWTAIVVGELEPGHDGMAIFLDLSTPWTARVKGVTVYSADYADGPSMTESFSDPIVIPLDRAVGDTTQLDTTITGNYRGMEDELGVSYEIGPESYDSSVDVPFGTLDGCVTIAATLSGELIGTGTIDVEVVAHPEQRIVRWVDSPGFLLAELKEGWH